MNMNSLGGSSLRELPALRHGLRKRCSSWDRTGGNDDRLHIQAGETAILADLAGTGCITHIWTTMKCTAEAYLRKVVIKMFWDGESDASVEVPIGDFFGMGHAMHKNFVSAPLDMSPEDGKSFNCWFPMPYSHGARIEVINESEEEVVFYYYIDYEQYDRLPDNMTRFHAQWHRENPTQGISEVNMTTADFTSSGTNLTGEGNYVILEAEGRGHYVGCHLDIYNLRFTDKWNWYGEGDDMIFIDGEPFPPTLHGTGTEDYFNTAYCPTQEFNTPYHGIILPGDNKNWAGKITLYRYHIQDPIMFNQSIKVTIEHGHNNHRSDDYSSTAYWYQLEPHKPFDLKPVQERLPRVEQARD